MTNAEAKELRAHKLRQIIDNWDGTNDTLLFMGGGSYTRANAEVCLLGVSKNTKTKRVVASHSVRQIIVAPVQHHSQKPAEARSRIRELTGEDHSYIELFARNTTPGWDVWGNEVNKYE